MLQNIASNTKTAACAVWKNKGIILLTALLVLMLILGAATQNNASGTAVVGIVRDTSAYGVFAEVGNGDSRCRITVEDGYPELLEALKSSRLDAALLPVRYLAALDMHEYTVAAVTSYMSLAVVEKNTSVSKLGDLNGCTVAMPDSLKDSLESKMLNRLISHAEIQVKIQFQSDETASKTASANEDLIMALPPDVCGDFLVKNREWRSCFNLADQWYDLLKTDPPAGSCVVVRTASLPDKAANISRFLESLKTSTAFINDKHKKAASLIAASGLGEDYQSVLKSIPHIILTYLDGDLMTESMAQLSALLDGQ